MAYMKITLGVTVHEDDAEVPERALTDAMDKIESELTVYLSPITTAELVSR
jgi:hypothetical protein